MYFGINNLSDFSLLCLQTLTPIIFASYIHLDLTFVLINVETIQQSFFNQKKKTISKINMKMSFQVRRFIHTYFPAALENV